MKYRNPKKHDDAASRRKSHRIGVTERKALKRKREALRLSEREQS